MAQQNAGEGPGLLRGLSEVPGSGKINFLSEVLGLKSLAPQLPVVETKPFQGSICRIIKDLLTPIPCVSITKKGKVSYLFSVEKQSPADLSKNQQGNSSI